jgi:hypothetical protein
MRAGFRLSVAHLFVDSHPVAEVNTTALHAHYPPTRITFVGHTAGNILFLEGG